MRYQAAKENDTEYIVIQNKNTFCNKIKKPRVDKKQWKKGTEWKYTNKKQNKQRIGKDALEKTKNLLIS